MWHEAYQSLMLRPIRALLSTLGIFFGVMAVVAMLSIGEGAKRETLKEIEALGKNNVILRHTGAGFGEDEIEALTEKLKKLGQMATLREIEGERELLAVSQNYLKLAGIQAASGRLFAPLDEERRQLVCVVGSEVFVLPALNEAIRVEGVPLTLVGVIGKGEGTGAGGARDFRNVILVPEALSTLFAKSKLTEVLIRSTQVEGVGAYLKQLYGDNESVQIVIPRKLLEQVAKTQRTFNIVLGTIALISLLVGGIGIMNIMLATVSERRKEIGVRRAVGASEQHIIWQFLQETLLLSTCGGVLGAIGGIVAAYGISLGAGWPTVVTPFTVVMSLGTAAIVGVASGLYPAVEAARVPPAIALRD